MRKVLKWIGILLAGLLVLAFVVIATIYFITEARINKTYDIAVEGIQVPDQLELGDRQYPLVVLEMCRECHGANLAGQIMDDDPMVGRLISANLTAGEGGIGATYTPEDWVRALRHGVGRDGKSLIAMPSNDLNFLSDTDLGIIISMVKSTAPVDNVLPKTVLGPMGRLFMFQDFPVLTAEWIEPDDKPAEMPEPGPTAEYGQYMANMCIFCHGKDFAGSAEAGAGLNLTPAGDLGHWTEADFIDTMRSGISPDGKKLDPEMMPVRITGKLSDSELKALWLFLQSLPPVESPTAVPAE